MNAVEVSREIQPDGRVFVTTRALRMQETTYVEREPDELVDAARDLIVSGGWQPGQETKTEIAQLVRGGMDLDHAFWQASGYDDQDRKEDQQMAQERETTHETTIEKPATETTTETTTTTEKPAEGNTETGKREA